MTFNMYWLHHSINLLKIVPFLGGWLSDRLLGDPEGWPHPMVWQSDHRRRERVE